jgi:hypothetical protein
MKVGVANIEAFKQPLKFVVTLIQNYKNLSKG